MTTTSISGTGAAAGGSGAEPATTAPTAGSPAASTGGSGAPRKGGGAGAFVVGFLPWIVYWILVGNAPFTTAVLVALGLSVLVNVAAVVRHRPLMVLEVGTAVVFAIFTVLAFTVSDEVLERWLQPLGNAGLFAIVTVSVLIGKPFTLQYAREASPPEMWDDPGFLYVCRLLAWVWVGAMGFMTVVSAIPPIVDGDATIRDAGDPLSVACYWVLPFGALGLAMLFTSKYPDWFGEAAGGDGTAPALPTEAPLPTDGDGDVTRAGGVALDVSPLHVLSDEPVDVRVSGLEPGATVTLSAETVDAIGHRWRSEADLVADGSGVVDLAEAAPVTGSWTSADRDGLIWSMAPVGDGEPELFIPSLDAAATIISARPATTEPRATAELRATLVRRATSPDVEVVEVREAGVVGRLFRPATTGTGTDARPGVVLFPGSEGGLDSQSSNAALLAAHGCVALVAAPFAGDGPPLPDRSAELARVPLERFTDAIRWLSAADGVDPTVSAMAISRGAEGLLAAASRSPELALRCIVAVSPSSLTWVGLGEHGSLQGVPAWTWQGQDLPAVQTDDRALFAEIAREALRRRGGTAGHGPALLHLVASYAPRLDDPEATGEAAIEVERIAAPLLLVAGEADEVWPSIRMARRIVERRQGASAPAADRDELHTHRGVGHLLRLGCWPATVASTGGIALGGTAEATARAQADLTARVLAAVRP